MGDLLEQVRLIYRSNPEELNRFAGRWTQVATEAAAEKSPIGQKVDEVVKNSAGLTAQQMSDYNTRTVQGLTGLAAAAIDVGAGLRQVAPPIAAIRKKASDTLAGDILGAPTVAFISSQAPSPWPILTGGVSGGLYTLYTLVTEFKTQMTAVRGAMDKAKVRMVELDGLDVTKTQTVLPQAPPITPN